MKNTLFSLFFPHIISFILVFGCGGSRRGGRGGGRPPPPPKPPPSGGGGGGGGPVGGKYNFLSVSQFQPKPKPNIIAILRTVSSTLNRTVICGIMRHLQ